MNELMLKISELLEVSVEAATELYPVLRDQYIFYQASKMLLVIVVIQMLFYLVLIIFRALTSFIEPDYPMKGLGEYKTQIALATIFFHCHSNTILAYILVLQRHSTDHWTFKLGGKLNEILC